MRVLGILLIIIICYSGMPLMLCKSANEWKSRIIYQILTDRFARTDSGGSCNDLSNYCGGSFQGIIDHLEYIQGLGANAIWISPVITQTNRGYHGYWAKNIFEINSHFGTKDDLLALVKACHSRDIWVMLDVVANHMGNQDSGNIYDFSQFVPFNDLQYYHKYCIIRNFSNQTEVEICRLAGLPDLDQSNQFVHDTLLIWIQQIISNYTFDGIRIDTIPEVPKDFWKEYSQSAGVFSIGECDNGDPNYVGPYQRCVNALLNYPMYYIIKDLFTANMSMYEIRNRYKQETQQFSDLTILGTFLDNHDNPRFLYQTTDWTLLINAWTFAVFSQGIPILYYGTEQGFSGSGDPNNREILFNNFNTSHLLYRVFSKINKFKLNKEPSFYSQPHIERYVDDHFYAFSRDLVFIAISNIGSGHNTQRTITYHPYSNGDVLINLLDESDAITVRNSQFEISITNGQPIILYRKDDVIFRFLRLFPLSEYYKVISESHFFMFLFIFIIILLFYFGIKRKLKQNRKNIILNN